MLPERQYEIDVFVEIMDMLVNIWLLLLGCCAHLLIP